MDSSQEGNEKQTRSKTSKKSINKIPISDNSKTALKKKRQRKAGGVIYIGHIPHGFYEDEMKSYFNQFGQVVAATVARSKKTGRSKGFGFVEFKDEEVAKIAAETMNNYLMFNRILKCRYIPPEENRGRVIERKVMPYDFPRQKNRKINEQQKEKAMSNLTQEKYLEKAQAKIDQFKKFFEERGIDFSFELKSKGCGSTNTSKRSKTKVDSNAASKSETDNGVNDELGVLEIDESENEISFTTPPHVKKVIRKSLTSNTTPMKLAKSSKKSEVEKQRINTLGKSSVSNTKKKGKIQKKTDKNVASIGKKLVPKSKNKEKLLKGKEFLSKDISTTAKQRKVKMAKSEKNKIVRPGTGSSDGRGSSKNKFKISIKAVS